VTKHANLDDSKALEVTAAQLHLRSIARVSRAAKKGRLQRSLPHPPNGGFSRGAPGAALALILLRVLPFEQQAT